MKKIDLTESERAEIAAMTQTPGWRIATEKMIQPMLELYREICTAARADIRFQQGLYLGFKTAREMIEKAAHPEAFKPELHFPKETDLRSRRSGGFQ